MKIIQILDLFSGAGGLSFGFKLAGFNIVLSVEKEKIYCDTYKFNNPNSICLNEDIKSLNCEYIKSNYLKNQNIDGIIGGPPCQGYSSVGNRNLNDPRNKLIYSFIEWVEFFKPNFFVMENVSGLVKGKMKLVFAEIMKELKASGYGVKCKLLNAMYFNVPQSRQRLIFIGIRR